MLNLILKDLLIQKKTIALLALYIIVFSIAFQNIGGGAFTAITIAITYQMVAVASSNEEKANSDIIMNSMPITRRTIVLSKYLSVFVYALLAVIGYMALFLISQLINIPLSIAPINLESLGASLLGVMLMNGIYYPVYFKLGYVKARIASFILFFVFFFGAMQLVDFIREVSPLQQLGNVFSHISNMQVFFILIGFGLGFTVLSYVLSLKFYTHREF